MEDHICAMICHHAVGIRQNTFEKDITVKQKCHQLFIAFQYKAMRKINKTSIRANQEKNRRKKEEKLKRKRKTSFLCLHCCGDFKF